jgi:hypothetical protein
MKINLIQLFDEFVRVRQGNFKVGLKLARQIRKKIKLILNNK